MVRPTHHGLGYKVDVGKQLDAPTTKSPGGPRYLLKLRIGESHCRYERGGWIKHWPFSPQSLQCTDFVTLTHTQVIWLLFISFVFIMFSFPLLLSSIICSSFLLAFTEFSCLFFFSFTIFLPSHLLDFTTVLYFIVSFYILQYLSCFLSAFTVLFFFHLSFSDAFSTIV